VKALAFFADPATGAPRLACACYGKVHVFDPVAGGDALFVLDIDSHVNALAVFKEPATSALRLACGIMTYGEDEPSGEVRIFDAVSGGDALLVLEVGDYVRALVAFNDLATGAPLLASASEESKVRVFDPLAGGEALVVLEGHASIVWALTVFTDPATGEPRLVSGSGDWTVRVWNLAGSGVAIEAEPEGHSDDVEDLVTFVDPVTGALRVVTCSDDETIRVWDAETGDRLLVINVGKRVINVVVAFFADPATGAPRLACGTSNYNGKESIGDVRVFDPVAGGEALVVIDVHGPPARVRARPANVGSGVYALAVFADPATGELRLACGCEDGKVRIYNPVAGGEALLVLDAGGSSLVVFTDSATGNLRLAAGWRDVGVWDLAAGGAALFVLRTGSVYALTAFADPATGDMRLASGSRKTLRVWDASKGGAALRVVPFDDDVNALAVRGDTSGLFVASGKRWGELRI
jgi:WD40 repeat protein